MFNPSNLDEVCVQATHLEARGSNKTHEGNKKPFSHGDKGKKKFKGNGKKNDVVKKEGEKFTCKHCSKDCHDEDHCWKLHPERRPKKIGNKWKSKTVTTIQHNLGYDSVDEMTAPPHPRRHGRSTRTFSPLGPKSLSSSNSRGSLLPTEILPRKSPFGNREIGSRDIARFVILLLVTQPSKPRMSMVNGQCPGYQAFPYRDIATGEANLLAFQPPNVEVPSFPTRSHLDSTHSRGPRCHATSGFRGSRVLDAVTCCWELRMPKLRCSGFVPPVPPEIDGSDQIGESHFAI